MPVSQIDVAVERKPGSQLELRVTAPAGEVDAAIDESLRRLAGRIRIPGFRPGKAPGPMVERAVGWDAVRHETVDRLVPELYRRAVEQEGVEPVSDPQVDVQTLEREKPLVFTATITVKPVIDLGDYRSLRVERSHTDVTEANVDDAVEEVRRRHATLRDVDRPAQAGDVLRCTLVMRHGDEVVGGEETGERDLELDRETIIPAIVDGIIGLSGGAERSFEVTLPGDYPREELRNTTVTVDVRVLTVRERELPPLDDSLAELDGHGTTLDELRTVQRERLEREAEDSDRDRFEQQALSALRDSVRVDVPQVMVEREIERQLADLEYRLAAIGIPLDKYLELSGQTIEKLRGDRREPAVQRVRLDLALDQLATEEGVEVDEQQVEQEARRISEGQRLSASQRQRLEDAARRDLVRRAAALRLLEIAGGDGGFVQT
ncbi:MAG: trigger factor [Candidatus Dormibacteraeota bacterium]|nr:trigger factor [Candidatus Dormibacteraeota bacterium]